MAQNSYKPSGALKKLVDAGKKPTRVLTSVERHVLAKPRDTSRRTDVIHPSSMVKASWCHRAQYFELLGHAPAKSSNPASMKQLLVFEEGHRIHHRWQGWIGDMGKLYGVWECRFCETREWGTGLSCLCDAGADYKEVPVKNDSLRIQGHADGWLKGFGDDLLLEIKSVGEGTFRWESPESLIIHGDFKKAWENLKQPFTTHIMQAQVYMKLLEHMFPEDHPKEALFIYESKVDQEVKEFVVPKSDFGVTELFDAAQMIVAAIESGTPVECNIGGANLCSSCRDFV